MRRRGAAVESRYSGNREPLTELKALVPPSRIVASSAGFRRGRSATPLRVSLPRRGEDRTRSRRRPGLADAPATAVSGVASGVRPRRVYVPRGWAIARAWPPPVRRARRLDRQRLCAQGGR